MNRVKDAARLFPPPCVTRHQRQTPYTTTCTHHPKRQVRHFPMSLKSNNTLPLSPTKQGLQQNVGNMQPASKVSSACSRYKNHVTLTRSGRGHTAMPPARKGRSGRQAGNKMYLQTYEWTRLYVQRYDRCYDTTTYGAKQHARKTDLLVLRLYPKT